MCDTAIDKVYIVLFLCAGNSARSILAEALISKLGGGRFKGYSACEVPTRTVNPHVLALLASFGFNPSEFHSWSWRQFARPGGRALDFIIVLSDDRGGEVCPVWPGQRKSARWNISDPEAAEGTEAEISAAFAETCQRIGAYVRLFLNLPMESIEQMSLQTKLRAVCAAADRYVSSNRWPVAVHFV